MLVLAGMLHSRGAAVLDGWAAALGGWAAALDGWAAARDAGAAALQWPGTQWDGQAGLLHGALLHSPAGLAAAPWLLALQRRPILLQRPAVDFNGGAAGLHGAQLHPPTGFAKTAALLWRAAVLGRAGLRQLAGLRHALAGPLNVAAEAAGVMAGGQVRDAHGAFVAAADGVVVARILVILAFTVVHLVAEMSKPSGIKSCDR